MSRLHFITSIPQNVERGSGCYVGTSTLARALRGLDVDVDMITPGFSTPAYLATRILFNEQLRWQRFDGDATIGIDADGYSIAGNSRRWNKVPHVACIKGVLGDAVRFERGATRASMAAQARLEAHHARRADLVITVSRYCAQRLEELYGVRNAVVIPELIDLEAWRDRFRANPAPPDPRKFTVLSVCRFYPRKRLDVLLRAIALLGERIPELEVRIVGNGPERLRLRSLARDLGIEHFVTWVGDASIDGLAREYNRADVFCLPSVQEGFGIVFLEAMAASKAILAADAAAVPEVVRNGALFEPDNPEALANGLILLHHDPDLRRLLGMAGARDVEEYDMHLVARQFLSEVAKIAPGAATPETEYVLS
ncbi:MAG TPA: glycosyltransferase family 4 protein [Bryobacteraceae bacterium]|jgi:glycosyltransferase involved in cell wall biosynthesis|nr:glycosyltransferase family 4 protein [Bryobacteraceae bacterium]